MTNRPLDSREFFRLLHGRTRRSADRIDRHPKIGRGVLLEPIDVPFDVKAWFGKLDEYLDEPFMQAGRQQPPMPPARAIFDE